MSSPQSLYHVLGVRTDCTTDEVNRAYRRLAMAVHPDKAGEEHRDAFLRLVYARDVLVNPRQRKHYDKYGESNLPRSSDEARWMEREQIFKEITLTYFSVDPVVPIRFIVGTVAALCSIVWLISFLHVDVLFEPSKVRVSNTPILDKDSFVEYFVLRNKHDEYLEVPPFSLVYDPRRAFTAEKHDPKTGIVYYVRPSHGSSPIDENLMRCVRQRYAVLRKRARRRIVREHSMTPQKS
ncbi:Heat shock protein 40 [Perkinsela sp. CCAP 1560/4]|nr:Heat shock protein 40 [Perkinsela sp. CCAP 1560/4]KNH03920.1 Heat shock protein 40 [Perkinsela sp. CCAP 1560/4]|eukprot:KNH01804.1 Heat shock protein 40 [Perkinsela sp. CCAP 1560/4]